jgi:hypothetical protein
LKVTYGQHFQLEAARDLIYFPYRLNGQDMFSFFHSSYNRWGNDLVDNSLYNKYKKRLGDESFKANHRDKQPVGFEGGGLRSDYLGMFEGFVPYEDTAQARANLSLNGKSNVFYEGNNKNNNKVIAPIFMLRWVVTRYTVLMLFCRSIKNSPLIMK